MDRAHMHAVVVNHGARMLNIIIHLSSSVLHKVTKILWILMSKSVPVTKLSQATNIRQTRQCLLIFRLYYLCSKRTLKTTFKGQWRNIVINQKDDYCYYGLSLRKFSYNKNNSIIPGVKGHLLWPTLWLHSLFSLSQTQKIQITFSAFSPLHNHFAWWSWKEGVWIVFGSGHNLCYIHYTFLMILSTANSCMGLTFLHKPSLILVFNSW